MSFSQPYFWWILPVLSTLSLAAGYWLYAKNPLQIANKWVQYLLIFFRSILVFLVLLLLLNPFFKWKQTQYLKPLLLLAIDNSQSMLLHDDAEQIQKKLPNQIAELKSTLENEFEVQTVLFSEGVSNYDSLNFKGKLTGFDALFDEANLRFSNVKSGAMLVVSDGNYNTGTEPSYLATDFKFPVFTVGTGDTQSYKDCWIHHLKYNELVYEGNSFTLEFIAQSKGFGEVKTLVQVFENAKCIATQSIQLKAGQSKNCFFELQSGKEGLHTYQIKLVPVLGEKIIINNQLEAVVEVLKAKQKIVLVYAAPHPDVAAIKQLLLANKNFDLDVVSLHEHKATFIQKADLYVLYQLPGTKAEATQLIHQLNEAQIPQFYFLGANTNLSSLNQLKLGIEIYGNRNSTTEAKAVTVQASNLFVSEIENSILEKFPPLLVPYGTYQLAPYAEVVLGQQIGYVKTDLPLLFFLKNHTQKKAFFCGEGLWHWKLLAYKQNGNNEFISSLLAKSIQYIAGKEDKSRFRVKPIKKLFNENEMVQFQAAYFNELFEPDNSAKVQLEVSNTKNKTFKFEFEQAAQAYQLNAGLLEPGTYQYQAEVVGIPNMKKKGAFQVKQVLTEQSLSGANHVVLKQLAAQCNAQFFTYANLNQLTKLLKEQNTAKQVIAETEFTKDLISIHYYFYILLFLAIAEWAVRKWHGFV